MHTCRIRSLNQGFFCVVSYFPALCDARCNYTIVVIPRSTNSTTLDRTILLVLASQLRQTLELSRSALLLPLTSSLLQV